MLDGDRKHYVTASQAHRVMAGFENELAGMTAEKPQTDNFKQIEQLFNKLDRVPKVGEAKESGIETNGAEIKQVCDYLKSQVVVFSEGMLSVALEMAMTEYIIQPDISYTSKDMERGNIQEGEAIAALEERTGIRFDSVADGQRFLTNGSIGATPDGVEYDGFEILSCAEVKNPKDTTHMKYLYFIRSQYDMLKVCPEYYWQAQSGLYASGADAYHWASYHNGFDADHRLVYCEIRPNEQHIMMLEKRAKRVIDYAAQIKIDINKRI